MQPLEMHRAAKCHKQTHRPNQPRTWLPYWLHGGRPVAISITVHATDQTSAPRPCPDWVITSGAIQ